MFGRALHASEMKTEVAFSPIWRSDISSIAWQVTRQASKPWICIDGMCYRMSSEGRATSSTMVLWTRTTFFDRSSIVFTLVRS